jgi:hypothetical protein
MPDGQKPYASTYVTENGDRETELKKEAPRPHRRTAEREGFVDGLLEALTTQVATHVDLVRQLANLQGQVSITERTLRITRDHLNEVLSHTKEATPPHWREVVASVRFVGARLGDACTQILSNALEPMALEDILDELNSGQFRFNTGSPLREINAALLRQPHAKRDKETAQWTWTGPRDGQMPLGRRR